MPLEVGLLLGAIVSSTDAAAVFSVLRSRSVRLKRPLRPLLELESGSNDPMAAFLTLGFLDLLTHPETALIVLVPLFITQMVIGALVGGMAGRASVLAVNRSGLEYEGLYPVLMIAVVVLTYGTATALGGSGFLAVYVAGLMMGNAQFLHKTSLMRFHDALAWLMQIAMFLVLGLLVVPGDLVAVAGSALVVSAVLVLLARPAAVFAALMPTRLPVRETLMVSWVGLRGAVPIILATFPLVENTPNADLVFNVVFFIVLTSVLAQGTTIPVVARWLHVDAPLVPRRAYPIEPAPSSEGDTHLHEIAIGSPAENGRLVDLHLPQGALVVLVSRDNEFLVPQGSTMLRAGDHVLLVADEPASRQARALLAGE